MPKKTKKQKIKIREHRANINEKIQNILSSESETIIKKSQIPHLLSFSFEGKSNKSQKTMSHDTTTYIQKDLLRTVILSFTAILTLIVLAFIMQKNF